MTGEMFNVKQQMAVEDRSGWTAKQHESFDTICPMRSFLQNHLTESRAFVADAILFVGGASSLFFGVMIFRALNTPKA